MTNDYIAQQSEIVERLTRMEVQTAASNQRIDDTNHRITETANMLLEAIRETNQRISETNQRVAETNQRVDESNDRHDRQITELRREFRADFNKLTYLILGTGAAVIATVIGGLLLA